MSKTTANQSQWYHSNLLSYELSPTLNLLVPQPWISWVTRPIPWPLILWSFAPPAYSLLVSIQHEAVVYHGKWFQLPASSQFRENKCIFKILKIYFFCPFFFFLPLFFLTLAKAYHGLFVLNKSILVKHVKTNMSDQRLQLAQSLPTLPCQLIPSSKWAQFLHFHHKSDFPCWINLKINSSYIKADLTIMERSISMN